MRLHSKGPELDNVEYKLKYMNEQANSGRHNQTEKVKNRFNVLTIMENHQKAAAETTNWDDNKILRHDNGTIVETYI